MITRYFVLVILALSFINVQAGTITQDPPSIRYGDLFSDRFEAQPLELFPRIDFISDRNAYFEGSGEQQAVAVRVFDADGNLVENPTLQWTSEDAGLLDVEAQGNGAVLESLGTWQGPINYSVEDTVLGISASGQAIMAEFQPGVVRIPSHWVLAIFGDRTVQHEVRLESNATTDAIAVGDIVLSGDYAGVMIDVTEVSFSGDDQVIVTGTPAPITSAFQNYQQQVEGEPLRIIVRSDTTQTRITIESLRDNIVLYDSIDRQTRAVDLLECEGDLELDNNITFEALNIEWEITPQGAIAVTDGTVDLFEFGVLGALEVDAQVSVNISSSITLEGKCEPDLPSINLGGVFVYGVMISPAVSPGISLTASASAAANVGWVPLSGLQREWTLEAGIRYTSVDGWGPYSDYSATGSEPEASGFQLDGEFILDVAAGAELDAGLRFCVGLCTTFTEIVQVTILEASGGPYFNLKVETPISPSDPDYRGPDLAAGILANATVGASATLFQSGVLSYFGFPPLSISLTAPIFDEDFVLLDPTVTGTVGCDPSCEAFPSMGGTLDLELAINSDASGTASFWLKEPGNPQLVQIATAPVSNGQATRQYNPGELSEGEYRVYGRLSPDGAAYWFADLLPLAPMTPIGEFDVQGQAFTFQQGVDGYGGTLTIMTAQDEPNTSFRSAFFSSDRLSVDAENTTFEGGESRVMIRFDDIVGGAGIPANAAIASATLTLWTVSSSPGPVAIGWLDTIFSATSTWNSMGAGGTTVFTEDTASDLESDTAVSFDVTQGVQIIVNGGINTGWLFFTDNDDGWDLCSEFPTCENDPSDGLTPVLTVTLEDDAPRAGK